MCIASPQQDRKAVNLQICIGHYLYIATWKLSSIFWGDIYILFVIHIYIYVHSMYIHQPQPKAWGAHQHFFGQELLECLLPAIKDFFSLPSTITAVVDFETVSFESIQLSTQGAERQRKDASWFSKEQLFCLSSQKKCFSNTN